MTWLSKLRNVKIKLWRYRAEIDPTGALHVGPMADEWARVMGVGNGATIDMIDGLGIALRCIQELDAHVAQLSEELERLRAERRK
jgi:uncharacterized small protein (DUF1192 family)